MECCCKYEQKLLFKKLIQNVLRYFKIMSQTSQFSATNCSNCSKPRQKYDIFTTKCIKHNYKLCALCNRVTRGKQCPQCAQKKSQEQNSPQQKIGENGPVANGYLGGEGGEDVKIKNSELKKLIADLQRAKQEREDFARRAKELQLEMKSKQLNVELQKMKVKQRCDQDLKTAQKEHDQRMQQIKKNHQIQTSKLTEKLQSEAQMKQNLLTKENEDLKKNLLNQKQELKRVSELEITLLKSSFQNEKQKLMLEMQNEKGKQLLRSDAREKELRQEAQSQIKSLKEKHEKEVKELQGKNERQRQLLMSNHKTEKEELASRLQREKKEIRQKLESEKNVLIETARKQDEINRRSFIDEKEALDKLLQARNQQFTKSILELNTENSKLKEMHSMKEEERTKQQRSYEKMIAEKNEQILRVTNQKERLQKYVQSHSHSLDHYQKQIIDFDRYIERSNSNIIEQFKSLDDTYDEPTPQKLKMTHLLIKQYKDIVASTKHPQLMRIITQKQAMVSNYVASEMMQSQKALQEMDVRDIHYSRSEKGRQFKRFIQKVNFFRSLNNQNINDNIDMYFHPKLILKLKALLISHDQKIVKYNNQISELDLIKEIDEFLETKEFLNKEFPSHLQPCDEQYRSINNNIKSAFYRFRNTYQQIKENKPAQKLEDYLNKAQQLKRFMQVVDHSKGYKKYTRALQDQLKIKVEDIKIALLEILNQNKKTLKAKLDNLMVTRVYFDCYLYQKIFKKLKVFDQILSKQENNFYDFNFSELYNKIINFLRILKQEKINLCDVLITEDKIIVPDLQKEFLGISFDQSIRIRYLYKLKNVLQNRNATLSKLGPNSIITNKHLQQFQVYFFEAKQLSTIKIINQLPELSQQLKLFSSKMVVIVDYLEFKFKECYGNSTELKEMDQTNRTIRHFFGFEQFVQKNFEVQHLQFKKRIVPIKYSYLPQPQSEEECMFSMLLRLNTVNHNILEEVVNTPEHPLKQEQFDYYTNLITYLPKVQGSKVQGKLHRAISDWISQLQSKEWLQGEANSANERKLLFNLNKLQNKEIAYYRQLINIHKNKIMDERQRIINSEKRKLKEEDFDNLQAFLVQCQKNETNNSKFNKLYITILEEYMNYSYDNIVNDIHKKTIFLQTIYKLTISDKARSVREIFKSKQHKIYFCRPELSSLKNNITQIEQFQGENDTNIAKMSETLVNAIKLYSIFKANEGKSLLEDKERQKLAQQITGITQSVVGNYLNLCRHLQHQKILQQKCNRKKIFVDLIKIEVYGRIMKKWQQFLPHHEYYNNRAIYEQILQKINAKIQRAYEQVRQFRFYKDELKLQYDNNHFLFEHLKRIERLVQVFKEIKYRLFKFEDFLKNNYLQGLNLKNISPKELVSIVEMSWIKQYAVIKKQISELFASPQLDIVLKYKMILSQKQIVKNENLLCFNEIIKEQYDFKRIVIDELMALQAKLERYLLILQKQYESFVLSEKKLDDKKKKVVQSEKTRIKNKYDKLIAEVQNSFHEIKDQAQRQRKIQAEINTLVNQARTQQELLLNQQASKMQNFRAKFTQKTDSIISKFFDSFLIVKKIESNFDTQIEEMCKKVSGKIQAQMNEFEKGLKNIFINFAKKSKNSDMILGMGSLNLFKQINEEQFHLNTRAMNNIHQIIKKCPQTAANPQLSQKLVEAFQDYQAQLQRVQKQFLQSRSENRVMQVIKETKSQARELPPAVTIARIFAVYSIYRCIDSHQDEITFDGNPHIAQVVAILLLIDAHNGRAAKFRNRLIEVKTGEGKSRVLAGLNCYLALCGFDVYCGCYSSYLSQRDQEEFHSLFVRFGVEKMISYGPFSAHCQSVFNEGTKHNFKEVTRKVLLNEPLSTSNLEYLQRLNKLLKRESRVNRVLVIDEVDVFFDQNYFGQIYAPGVAIEGPEVKRLIKFIWENHTDKKLNRLVFQSEQYKNLVSALPHLTQLLKNQVQSMIHACNNWNIHPYEIRNNEIQYVDNDSVNSKLNFGYSTAFASCYEYERGKISEVNYNKNINISLIIGQFSYAELPKYFDNIMGVSGTVEAMSDFRKKIMYEDYKVTDIYTLPSIYGDSHRKILGFHSCDKSEYLPYLLERIHDIRRTQRPILVFFQTEQQLNLVSNSPQFNQFTTNIYKITQKMPPEMRNPLINYAGTKNRITLISSAFSRGTDFTVYDSDINEKGGMHVIQTYVSKNESDFIQILGRTGRQGKNGSFEMIVTTQDLKNNEIPLVGDQQLSAKIRQSWKIHDVKHGRVLAQSIQDARKLHEVTFQVVGSMAKENSKLVNAVMKLNFVQIKGETIRTVIAIDGTGSMGAALNAVLNILNDTISRTDQIISMRMPNVSFQHKIMIYRNYNTNLDKILQQSNFSKDSEYLKAFMTSIKPEGGLGNEAHQILFYDVGQQLQYDKIDQIIIIGDAPANKYEETCKHRKKFRGDDYWNAKYPLLASIQEYSAVVKAKKIPIHSFYILRRKQEEESIKWDKNVKIYFEGLSNDTKGSFEELNIRDKEKSKDQLTDFISQRVLELIGGRDLIELYSKMYSKRYV